MTKDLNLDYFTGYNAFTGIYGYSIGYFILGGLSFYNRAWLNTKKIKYFSVFAIAGSMLLLSCYGIIASKRQNEIWDIVWYGYDTIFTLINVVVLFVLTMNYRESGLWGKFIKTTGENSLGIYLVFILVGSFAFPYFLQFQFNSLIISNAVFAFIILIISLFIVLLLKKIPVLKYLFSI
jgi:peptidoglycan/LPS O-acetylase OafA/YrhL